ncbi:MAG TPA: DUF3079 domain-containing protein [Paucimonas sp.]|nr:DUF3079 domain-containing protein [Paucimonas sp.]
MVKKLPWHPKRPERTCRGCGRYCPAALLACGNGSERARYPTALFREDEAEWGTDAGGGEDDSSAVGP